MKTYPILRLVIPLATGVFFAEYFHELLSLTWIAYALFALFILLGGLLFLRKYECRWMFGFGVMLFMFLLGNFLFLQKWQQVKVEWPSEKMYYSGVVQETPVEKKRTMQCKVQLNERNVLLYVWKDSLSREIKMGDRLLFQTQIAPPTRTNLSGDFDYASYLLHQGISGTSFISSGRWTIVQEKPCLSLKQKALQIRNHIVNSYKEWGIGEEQLPVLAALTVGAKMELDAETRTAYSTAGIAHVLALSGLHIAIVWLLLDFLLRPLERTKGLRRLKWLLSTGFLWSFAFIAGLEASVVRAVIMCMLLELGKLMGSRVLSMNTLAIAAFFMLLYNPFYLFDVGFQLSFIAVASILLFYPVIYKMWRTKSLIVKWGWGTVSVSLAAQLGTAPLVMYYFSTFSVYFLLANLIVAIWVPLIIYVCALLALVAIFFKPFAWLVWVLDKQVLVLNEVAEHVSRLPYATISWTEMSRWEVFLLYVLFALVLWHVKVRRHISLIVVLFGVVVLLLVRLSVVSGILT